MRYYQIPGLDTNKRYYASHYNENSLEVAILTEEKVQELIDNLNSKMNEPEFKDNTEFKSKCRSLIRFLTILAEMEYIKEYGAWSVPGRIHSNWDVKEGNVLIVEKTVEDKKYQNWLSKHATVVLLEVKKDENISESNVVRRRTLFVE